MIIRRTVLVALCLAGVGSIQPLNAAPSATEEVEVRASDAAYWRTYNACDLKAMAPLLTEDAEFYHDKTGLTATRRGIVNSIKRGICSDPNMRLRREEVSGSVQFHAMAGGYALETGVHRFYVRQKGKNEYLDGQANFTVVWKHVGEQWQMHRILSYDHGPAPYQPPHPALTLSAAQLATFTGRYTTPKDGDIVVTAEGDHLRLKASHVSVSLYPSAATTFFALERALQFDFTDRNHVLTVIEKGGPVAVAKRVP
jgi:ketosteroid isomerase-like protein